MSVQTQSTARAYRFHDVVALHTTAPEGVDSCPTVYLTPQLAAALGAQLIRFALSCDARTLARINTNPDRWEG